jgi:hypothetical protein
MVRLKAIDRRVLYLVAALLVLLTRFVPLGLPVSISPLVQHTFNTVENLPDGSVVVLSPMYNEAGDGSMTPFFTALLVHCAERGYRLLIGSTDWTDGPEVVHPVVTRVLTQYGYVYGRDYLEWGSRPGGEAWLRAAAGDFAGACGGTDRDGRSLTQFELAARVPRLTRDYVAAIICVDIGTPGVDEWRRGVAEPTGIPVITAWDNVAFVPGTVDFDTARPGIYGRLALAEYEYLLGYPGAALREQDAMSVPALIVTLFVVLGNAGHLAAGLAARRSRKAHGLRPGAGGTRTDNETGPGD